MPSRSPSPRPARPRRPARRSPTRPPTAIRNAVAAGPADDPRRHARRRRPLQHRRSASSAVDRHDDARRRFAEQRAPTSIDRRRARRRPASTSTLGADAARVEAAFGERHRQAAVRAVVRRSNAAARRASATSSSCSARFARQIERRRHAAHQIVHDLQVLAAAELAAALAEQHDRVARRLEAPADARDRRARAGRRRR